MKNFIQPGENITVTAPADVVSGALVVVGSLIGVATYSAASGADVEIATEGVYELTKATADDVAVGDRLYWDGSKLTKTPGTNSKPLVGIAVKAAGNGATTVQCRLMLTGATGPSA